MKKEIVTKIASLIVASVLIICSSVMSFVSCSQRSKKDRNTYGYRTSKEAADAFFENSIKYSTNIFKTLPKDLVDDLSEYYLYGIDIDEFMDKSSKSLPYSGLESYISNYSYKKSFDHSRIAKEEVKEIFDDSGEDNEITACYDKFDPDEITSVKAERYKVTYDYDDGYDTDIKDIYTFKYKGRWYTTALIDEIF